MSNSDLDINEFIKLYQSKGNSDIYTHAYLVDNCVEKGIVPKSIRYTEMSNGNVSIYRGGIISSNGNHYYFNWPKSDDANFTVVKASTPDKLNEVSNIMKSLKTGCDLMGEEDEDELEKAPGSPVQGTGMAVTPEGTNPDIQTMDAPSSAIATTPDDPNVGRDWHKSYSNKDALNKLRSIREQFIAKKSTPSQDYKNRFLNENKNISLVKSNSAKVEKAYSEWQSKDIKSRLGSLQSWINKNK